MTVRLHIERLVVEGAVVTRAEADRLRAALETELSERLSQCPPESWTGLAVPALTLEPIAFSQPANFQELGRGAGAALLKGLQG